MKPSPSSSWLPSGRLLHPRRVRRCRTRPAEPSDRARRVHVVPRVYGAETSAAGRRSPAARTVRTRARLCLCLKPGVFHTRPFLPVQTPAPHLCAPAGAIPGDAGVPPATFVPGKSSHSGARWASAEVPESVQKRPCARSVMLTDRAQYYPTRTWGEETFCLNEKCPWLIANCVLWRYCFSLSLTGKRRQ